MVEDLRFRGSIREVTINRTAGTWFACFCVEDGAELPPVKDGPTIGVDVGIKTLAVTSDGQEHGNPRCYQRGERKLRRINKTIARSIQLNPNRRTNRRARLYEQRARLQSQQAHRRQTHHRQTASAIAKSAGTVVVDR